MAMHPETAAWVIAGGMVNVLRDAAQVATDRRDQAALDAWSHELASARGDAARMGQVAVAAIRQLADNEAEIEALHEEVSRLRQILAQRNAMISQLSQ